MGENGNGNGQGASFIRIDFAGPGISQFNLSMQSVTRDQLLNAIEWLHVMVDDQIRAEIAQAAQRQPRIAVPGLAIRQ